MNEELDSGPLWRLESGDAQVPYRNDRVFAYNQYPLTLNK